MYVHTVTRMHKRVKNVLLRRALTLNTQLLQRFGVNISLSNFNSKLLWGEKNPCLPPSDAETQDFCAVNVSHNSLWN